ncbi:hypothetical protein [Aeromicrobium sp.]|uniref:hypothetical protein n=1 Tax=Aeromicrobium sp. TaxID=1871063 RepID=UPI0028A8BA4A|nr:hypothetical protein [Aeromicrobium sp.]
MDAGSRTTSELTVLVFVQTFFGSGFLMPLRESGAPWNLVHALVGAAMCLVGLTLLWFAAQNAARLWRVSRGAASRRNLVMLSGLALLGALLFAGPLLSGVWVWRLTPLAMVAAFLFLVLGLELRARFARRQHVSRNAA